MDLSHIPRYNGTESRSEWKKIQLMSENVHYNLTLVLLFKFTEVEWGKGLFEFPNFICLSVKRGAESTALSAINLLTIGQNLFFCMQGIGVGIVSFKKHKFTCIYLIV